MPSQHPDVLPDSRTRARSGGRVGGKRGPDGATWVQLYCANCGKPYGLVPEESIRVNFAFALCEPCAETFGDDAHFWREPDHVFFERVHEAMLERYGRSLTASEIVVKLDDPSSIESKLKREWDNLILKAG